MDKDRYDHTYCKILKSSDGIDNCKNIVPDIFLRNDSAVQVLDFDPLIDHQVEVGTSSEPDNGSSQSDREPMIIVRTKRARKPTPVVVRAFNVKSTTKDGYIVGTVMQSDDTDIISSNRKGTDTRGLNAIEDDPIANEDKITSNRVIVKEVNRMKKDINFSESNDCAEVRDLRNHKDDNMIAGPSAEEPKVTKSGRRRKLTAKAKQMSEESKKKSASSVYDERCEVLLKKGRPVGEYFELHFVSINYQKACACFIAINILGIYTCSPYSVHVRLHQNTMNELGTKTYPISKKYSSAEKFAIFATFGS